MTPEQEEQVRRALAATTRRDADATMPPEVVARLEGILDELAAPRRAAAHRGEAADRGSRLDELGARRRRRRPDVLVAAAAVSVIAFAGAAVATGGFGLGRGPGESSTSATSSSSRDEVTAPRSESTRGAAPNGDAGGAAPGTPGQPRSLTAGGAADRRLRTATLTHDVQRLAGDASAFAARGEANGTAGPSAETSCAQPAIGRGEQRIAVRLDGRPATLVLGVPADGTRAARVYSCDDAATPRATTRVRTR